jgi:hypothetical protein
MPSHRVLSRVCTALLLATLTACGSQPDDPCDQLTPTVNVTGPAPVFDWTSACPVAAVEVAPSDSADAFVWFVLGDPGFNSIFPPVTFGAAPQGGGVGTPITDSLVSGRQYRVTLRRTTGPANIGLSPAGGAEFTAP